jgi:glycerophosphoryl diester phosphodiesterase
MKPVVIAHRGASYDFAEHTYDAYVSAIEGGADALECDVRLTVDKVLLCWHDSDLKRTSDGKGRISKLTWDEIRGVDSGSWHRAGRAAKPLLFSDLLHLAIEAGKSLSIETKHPVRSGGEVERALAEILVPYLPVTPIAPALAQFRMMSFSKFAVKRWQRMVPSIPAVALIGSDRFIGNAPIVGPGIDLIRRDPSLVERLHRQGREVHVWTVDGLSDIALCLKLGVDAIITNRPADVIAAIGD